MSSSTFRKIGATSGNEGSGSGINSEVLKRSVAVPAIIAYPTLVTPDPEYGNCFQALLIIDKSEPLLKALLDLVADHAEMNTGTRKIGPKSHNPFRVGDEPARSGDGFAFRDDAFRGNKIVVRGKSKFPVKCVWGPNRTPCDPADIEGGDHVVAELSAYWFSQQGNTGVGIGLNAVWLIRKGETKIERGGLTGATFEGFDTSGIEFDSGNDTGAGETDESAGFFKS